MTQSIRYFLNPPVYSWHKVFDSSWITLYIHDTKYSILPESPCISMTQNIRIFLNPLYIHDTIYSIHPESPCIFMTQSIWFFLNHPVYSWHKVSDSSWVTLYIHDKNIFDSSWITLYIHDTKYSNLPESPCIFMTQHSILPESPCIFMTQHIRFFLNLPVYSWHKVFHCSWITLYIHNKTFDFSWITLYIHDTTYSILPESLCIFITQRIRFFLNHPVYS